MGLPEAWCVSIHSTFYSHRRESDLDVPCDKIHSTNILTCSINSTLYNNIFLKFESELYLVVLEFIMINHSIVEIIKLYKYSFSHRMTKKTVIRYKQCFVS